MEDDGPAVDFAEEFGLLLPGKPPNPARPNPEPQPERHLDLDVLGQLVFDVEQFEALDTPEQRKQCLELLSVSAEEEARVDCDCLVYRCVL